MLGFNPKRGITTLQFTTQRASQMERQAGNMLGIRGDTLKLENGTMEMEIRACETCPHSAGHRRGAPTPSSRGHVRQRACW